MKHLIAAAALVAVASAAHAQERDTLIEATNLDMLVKICKFKLEAGVMARHIKAIATERNVTVEGAIQMLEDSSQAEIYDLGGRNMLGFWCAGATLTYNPDGTRKPG